MTLSEGDNIRIETESGFWTEGYVEGIEKEEEVYIHNFFEEDWGGVDLEELVSEDDSVDEDGLFVWDIEIILDGEVDVWVPTGHPESTGWENLDAGEVTDWYHIG